MRNDVVVQVRNNLYTIGVVVGLLVAVALSQLANPNQMHIAIPALMILVIGGSTLAYVAAMIVFERDDGTLSALVVSPLRPAEYLWSKVVTLSVLGTLEAIVMVGGAMVIMRLSGTVAVPKVALLLLGIFASGIVYVLIGIILIVRYDNIVDYLFPMAFVAVVLQLPFFYFFGLSTHPVFLLIPTGAPVLLVRAAYVELDPGLLLFGVCYTTLLIAGLTFWALRAFRKHVIQQAG